VDVASAVETMVNGSANSDIPVVASLVTASATVCFSAVCSGSAGNYINIRFNYYDGQTFPSAFTSAVTARVVTAGATNPSVADVWAVIEDVHFNYIIHPYASDSSAMAAIESELEDRAGALINQQGHAFGAYAGTAAACTTLGNARNSPYSSIMGMYDSPTDPAEIAAVLGAVAAKYLNSDPARPLQFLKLKGVLPPPVANRFTRAERDVLLYDGIATSITDTGGNVCIERCITTYQANALGLPDPSYLDIQTMATLSELRYQFITRMANRFIIPRFKLADDTFPVQPGQFIATPRTVRSEIMALFTLMRDKGWIENLEDFEANLVVERDTTDVNRVNVLLPPDLINQFRIVAGRIEFVL
jgi:phage tail sheath gpL-like